MDSPKMVFPVPLSRTLIQAMVPVLVWALVPLVGGLIGCGSSQFGADPRVPVAQRHAIAPGSPAGQNLELPGERGFNIHLKQSSQTQGAAGQARGSSDADSQGNAFAEVDASGGGSAGAEFKLGHRIDNHSSTAQTMAARIHFTLNQKVEASSPASAQTLAKADLVLVVIDSHNRVVSKSVVVQADSDDSTGTAVLPQQRSVTARLEPDESYDVVLFGRVDATSGEGQRSVARLEIDGLQFSLSFEPLASQPAVSAVRE